MHVKRHELIRDVSLLIQDNDKKLMKAKRYKALGCLRGVWQSFDRHGEVVDVFIPRRRNRFGERFGFVRMATRAAVDRVIERLNGFWLYGSRITVAFAGSNHFVSGGHGGVYRRVTGVLDGSKKEVLETCAVAWCKGRLRGEALVTELRRVGFTGCSVLRAAGDVVLLLFVTAEERQSMLDRSDLDKWFAKVLPWSPDIGFDSHSVWLSVLGVPMQFWSQDTFRNVAQLWGSLVRLDESTVDPKSFEQARLLIETKHWDRIMETIEVDCDGRLVPVRVQELEVVHAHDVVCRCEEVDASNEESDRETTQDDLAELPGQVERGITDNGEQDGPPGEKEITIWREEPLLAVSGEVVPAKMAVGDREFHAVIESKLDSTLQKDRPTFSNTDLVGEENLSVVPIEVSAVVPGQFGVSHSNPSKIVVIGGVSRKVRSVNDLVINTVSWKQRTTLLRAQNKRKGRKADHAVQRGCSFANASLSDSDFRARQQAILREAEATVQLGSLVGVETVDCEKDIIQDIIQDISRIIANRGTTL
ncbi:hypothetical protein GQ457_07G008010 [Hibiscus cannabinus]